MPPSDPPAKPNPIRYLSESAVSDTPATPRSAGPALAAGCDPHCDGDCDCDGDYLTCRRAPASPDRGRVQTQEQGDAQARPGGSGGLMMDGRGTIGQGQGEDGGGVGGTVRGRDRRGSVVVAAAASGSGGSGGGEGGTMTTRRRRRRTMEVSLGSGEADVER